MEVSIYLWQHTSKVGLVAQSFTGQCYTPNQLRHKLLIISCGKKDPIPKEQHTQIFQKFV